MAARKSPRSLIGRTIASSSKSVLSCSRACCRWAGWYEAPSRLQATRSAFGATAAVGSICRSVSWCTTVSRSVGRGASSIWARTAIRRASAASSRWTPTNRGYRSAAADALLVCHPGNRRLREAADRPSPSWNHERFARQQTPAMLPQLGLACRVKSRHVGTGRADATRERLPPLLERRVLEVR